MGGLCHGTARLDAHHVMLCPDNEIGVSQFLATEVYRPAVNPAVSHASAMELCVPRPVTESGSRTTSRLPCHHRHVRGRTVVRVVPEERSTKPPPQDRKPLPEQRKAPDERKT